MVSKILKSAEGLYSTMEVKGQHPCLQWKSRASTPVYHGSQGPESLSTMEVKPAPLSTMEVKGQPPCLQWKSRASTPVYHGSQ